ATIRGRVVDADGRAAAGLPVVLTPVLEPARDELPTATSGRDGTFTLLIAGRGEQRLALSTGADTTRWRTVLDAIVNPAAPPHPPLVVVAPVVDLAGRVLAPDGTPLPLARLRVVWPEDLRARLSDNSDAASATSVVATPQADGRFALAAAAVRGAELLTT